jgi:hypothetical protein
MALCVSSPCKEILNSPLIFEKGFPEPFDPSAHQRFDHTQGQEKIDMGSFADPNGAANANLHSFILGEMKGLRRSSVVSINAIVDSIRDEIPSCSLPQERLIKLITETAMLLGLVSVLDRRRLADDDDEPERTYGYGRPAQWRSLDG